MLRSSAILLTVMCLSASLAFAEGNNEVLLSGYAGTLKGPVLEYPSCQPDANSALLVRSLDSANAIEWETAPVPAAFSRDSATFVWVFGLNGNLEVRPFHLYVEGTYWLTFERPEDLSRTTWSVRAGNGSVMRFSRTLVDKNNDLFGYAFLTVPKVLLTPGKPLQIRVQGESAGSRTWYMTFQHTLHDTIIVNPQDALLRDSGAGLQPVYVDITRLHESGNVSIRPMTGTEVHSGLRFGFNRIIVKVPGSAREQMQSLKVVLDGVTLPLLPFVQRPVRKWTVYMVEHAHTDIGYTRPQTEILPEHLRFIDYALDYCDQTDSLPDDAKFRWTCEASWPVSQYVQCRPHQQVERLLRRIREGRIEVTAMMFNMSELPDENSYVSFLKPILQLRQMGIPVKTAMQDDVNGAAWCLVDYFHGLGIRYLTMGENPDRALRPFNIPTSFWWESPSGNKLLVFRADHYMTGNFMGIERGQLDIVEPAMFQYLHGLETQDYPFDRVAVQYSGYYTDNSPPSTAGCRVIEAWNKKYLWPHLRNATDGEFPQYVEKEQSQTIAHIRAAWPDWWTDGTASAPRETAAARRAQAGMIADEGLLAMARLAGNSIPPKVLGDVDAINEKLLFYDEHTFGAAESITDPLVENSEVQWSEKRAYVWEAVKSAAILRECGLGMLQGHLPSLTTPSLSVFNTLCWQRSGLVTAYIDNQIIQPDHEFRIVDDRGNTVPVQRLARRADGTYWALWAPHVPPLGFTTFRIDTTAEQAGPLPTNQDSSTVLDNRYYRIILDLQKGSIRSIYDKEQKTELIDATSTWGAGEFIRETLTDRDQMAQFKLVGYNRTTLSDVHFKSKTNGSIWRSIVFAGHTDACYGPEGVTCEVRLFNTQKRIEVLFTAMKRPITDPEALYVAFPFRSPGGTIRYDAQGGVVIPGVTQIPGSSSDWQTVQNFAAVRGNTGQIVIGSDECPLFQFGDINTGKFQRVARVDHPYMFSWPMNNYWTTNFVAEEDGELHWGYYLTSSADTSNSFATQFGWGSRVPLVARVLPALAGTGTRTSRSFLESLPKNILLISAIPSQDGQGIVLQLRETDGRPTSIHLAEFATGGKASSVTLVNALGENIRSLGYTAEVRPYEVVFVKIRL